MTEQQKLAVVTISFMLNLIHHKDPEKKAQMVREVINEVLDDFEPGCPLCR